MAIDPSGNIAAGYGWEKGQQGTIRTVKWTQQTNGSWTLSIMPLSAGATGAKANGVNRNGDIAGVEYPGTAPHPLLWLGTGGSIVLGCSELGEANAISADGQVAVGIRGVMPSTAPVIWRPGVCSEALPPLTPGLTSNPQAVNGDGTIIGGTASLSNGTAVPVRWSRWGGQWQIEQLDSRSGAVSAANSAGDLAGYLQVACADPAGCQRAVIWYAAGKRGGGSGGR